MSTANATRLEIKARFSVAEKSAPRRGSAMEKNKATKRRSLSRSDSELIEMSEAFDHGQMAVLAAP